MRSATHPQRVWSVSASRNAGNQLYEANVWLRRKLYSFGFQTGIGRALESSLLPTSTLLAHL